MKKLLSLLFLFVIFLFCFVSFSINAETNKFFTISANPCDDCNNSMNIVWHTEKNVTGTYVVYTKKSDTGWNNSTRVNATSEQNKAFAGLNAKYGTTSDSLKYSYELTKNSATLTNLDPGTEYMYKISDGSVSSDVRYFKTGNKEFNFVWISDFHAYYADARRLTSATRAIDKCIALENNNIDFILSTGDTIAHGGTYQWWKQVSEASWMKKYMFCTTLGNHDWMTNVGTNYSDGASFAFMDACFNNPKNGFSGQENICYYFYYGDALFVCMNTEIESAKYLNMTSDQFIKAQQDWVESVLKDNHAQYIFLMQHYQAFGTSGAFSSTGYNRWHEICDKYGVDIFFSGNSHVYMRSLPIYKDALSTDSSQGTVYMVAPSSDGERGVEYSPHTKNTDLIVKSWSDSRAAAASVLEVTSTGINFKLVNYNGDILDSATILPKRSSSADLTDFNKEAFEKSFNVQVTDDELNPVSLSFAKDAFDVLRTIKVYNKDTNQVYYYGSVGKDATMCALNKVEKGNVNIEIELRYLDSTSKILSFTFENTYSWKGIYNPRITKIDEKYYLEWDERDTVIQLSSISILLDNKRYSMVDLGTKKVELPSYDGKHVVSIVVKDKEGDVIYTSEDLKYEILQYYKVTFVDESGNELKVEEVAEGSSATAPEYQAPKGYKFLRWDTDYSEVYFDITVKAIVEKDSGCKNAIVVFISLFVSFSLWVVIKKKMLIIK